jgi:hypothetical protein
MAVVPVILCDEWSETQVKAFRLMVNRSVTWADWDTELLAIEIKELQAIDFDLILTGFDPSEIDDFLFGDEEDPAQEDIPEPSKTRSRGRAICGSAGSIAYFVETRLPKVPSAVC